MRSVGCLRCVVASSIRACAQMNFVLWQLVLSIVTIFKIVNGAAGSGNGNDIHARTYRVREFNKLENAYSP